MYEHIAQANSFIYRCIDMLDFILQSFLTSILKFYKITHLLPQYKVNLRTKHVTRMVHAND